MKALGTCGQHDAADSWLNNDWKHFVHNKQEVGEENQSTTVVQTGNISTTFGQIFMTFGSDSRSPKDEL